MAPALEPTPANPYVCDQFQGKRQEMTCLCGIGELSPPWPAESGTHNSNGDEEIQVELGIELVSLQQSDDGVQVKLHKRHIENSEFEEEISTYEWVIGADGARGAVRKLLGLTFLGETTVEQFVVGDINVEGLTHVCFPFFLVIINH